MTDPRFTDNSAPPFALDDLWRLAYFSGDSVSLQVAGGHATRSLVHFRDRIYDYDTERAELWAVIRAVVPCTEGSDS